MSWLSDILGGATNTTQAAPAPPPPQAQTPMPVAPPVVDAFNDPNQLRQQQPMIPIPKPAMPPVSTTDALKSETGTGYAGRIQALMDILDKPKEQSQMERIGEMVSRGGLGMYKASLLPGADIWGSIAGGLSGAGNAARERIEEDRENARGREDDIIERIQRLQDAELQNETRRQNRKDDLAFEDQRYRRRQGEKDLEEFRRDINDKIKQIEAGSSRESQQFSRLPMEEKARIAKGLVEEDMKRSGELDIPNDPTIGLRDRATAISKRTGQF